MAGTSPPLCAAHGGSQIPSGAPPGNRNAVTHGAYADLPGADVDLSRVIADLDRRIKRLDEYIDKLDPPGVRDQEAQGSFVRLVTLYGQLCSRLGRLMRDQVQVGGGRDSELEQAMNDALDLAGSILGVDL